MHAILALAALACSAQAAHNLLLPRQGGDAFVPLPGQLIDNCPFLCGEDCVIVSKGDSCCSEGYGCPGGSFCLTQGFCCPDGDDPSNCAAQNGITLPAGFKPGQTVANAPSTPAQASTKASTPTTTPATTQKSATTPKYTTPTAAGTGKLPTGTGSAPGGKSTTPAPFTGAGSVTRAVSDGGILAVLLGVAGFFF